MRPKKEDLAADGIANPHVPILFGHELEFFQGRPVWAIRTGFLLLTVRRDITAIEAFLYKDDFCLCFSTVRCAARMASRLLLAGSVSEVGCWTCLLMRTSVGWVT